MKLDRNNNPNRMGKYALLKLRNVSMDWQPLAPPSPSEGDAT